MYYPPTIPINFLTFLLFSLFWGGVSFAFAWKTGDRSREFWVLHVLTGLLASLASLLLLTSFSFVPDDWSAVRMAVPLSLFYGYPLYPDITSDPANCNVYLPLGFLHYIPASFLGFVLKSPTVCLFFGWITSLILFFTPLLILIYRLTIDIRLKIIIFLLAFIITFSVAPLRYVATMIHVDALSIFLLGGALCIVFPNRKLHDLGNYLYCIFGALLGASLFVKQTTIPITLLILLLALIIFPKSRKKVSLSFFISLFIFGLFSCVFIDFKLIWFYCIELASKTPQVSSVLESSSAFLNYNYQLIILFAVLLFFQIGTSKFSVYSGIQIKNYLFLSPVFIVSTLLSIYTFTKWGADSNHFILPSYLLLIFIIVLICDLISLKLITYKIAVISFAVLSVFAGMKSYLSTYCGWYLWVNNPHEISYQVSLKFPGKFYFPWQPIGSLMAEGKFYHLDPGLQMDPITKSTNYSQATIEKFLPSVPFFIAVRPWGRESYLVQKLNGSLVDSSELLQDIKSWNVYLIK